MIRCRYKKKPDERYYFPYASSYDLGWRLRDFPDPQIPEFGAKSSVKHFYQRNASSIQRDPDWYRMCQTSDPKNFNEILTY